MLTNFNLLELTTAEYSENKSWMIIHTKSRREKKIAQYCNSMDIKYYLPLETRIKNYGRKKVQTTLPLFPGYLFCLANEKERYQLLLTHHIANILKVSNHLELLEDIKKIFIAESADYSLRPCELHIEGIKARIKTGPLSGIEGIVSRLRGKDCIVLNVNIINRATAVYLNRADITIVN